jgi:hypothetical protein
MRKILVVLSVLLMVMLVLAVGCSKESSKKVVSKPVAAKPVGEPQAAAPTTEPAAQPEETPAITEETSTETEVVTPAGTANCESLLGTDINALFGGTWSKAKDCPQRPAMPKGVNVCLCAYEGPRHMYVNVETQLYGAASDALRVYNMYCKGATEQNEVGEKSCRFNRTSTLTPNFVYFLKGKYFAKISCLGSTCPLDGVAMLAQKVGEKI